MQVSLYEFLFCTDILTTPLCCHDLKENVFAMKPEYEYTWAKNRQPTPKKQKDQSNHLSV